MKKLYAEHGTYGWSVVDSAGGRWWPSDEVREQIEAASDPGAEALSICLREPTRGAWVS